MYYYPEIKILFPLLLDVIWIILLEATTRKQCQLSTGLIISRNSSVWREKTNQLTSVLPSQKHICSIKRVKPVEWVPKDQNNESERQTQVLNTNF